MKVYVAEKSATIGPGKLAGLVKQVRPETVWTASQHNFMRTHESRRPQDYNPNQWVWTGDGSSFGRRGNEPTNVLTPAPYNPVLLNAEQACKKILKKGFYLQSADESHNVMDAAERGEGVIVRLNALDLKKDGDTYGYVLINTKN